MARVREGMGARGEDGGVDATRRAHKRQRASTALAAATSTTVGRRAPTAHGSLSEPVGQAVTEVGAVTETATSARISSDAVPMRGPALDDMVCTVCGVNENDELVLLCEICNGARHTYCCVPPLSCVPDEDYICPECMLGGNGGDAERPGMEMHSSGSAGMAASASRAESSSGAAVDISGVQGEVQSTIRVETGESSSGERHAAYAEEVREETADDASMGHLHPTVVQDSEGGGAGGGAPVNEVGGEGDASVGVVGVEEEMEAVGEGASGASAPVESAVLEAAAVADADGTPGGGALDATAQSREVSDATNKEAPVEAANAEDVVVVGATNLEAGESGGAEDISVQAQPIQAEAESSHAAATTEGTAPDASEDAEDVVTPAADTTPEAVSPPTAATSAEEIVATAAADTSTTAAAPASAAAGPSAGGAESEPPRTKRATAGRTKQIKEELAATAPSLPAPPPTAPAVAPRTSGSRAHLDSLHRSARRVTPRIGDAYQVDVSRLPPTPRDIGASRFVADETRRQCAAFSAKVLDTPMHLLWRPPPSRDAAVRAYLEQCSRLLEMRYGLPITPEQEYYLLLLLLQCHYDDHAAYRVVHETDALSPHRVDSTAWSTDERSLFARGIVEHGKQFRLIRRHLLPHRSVPELVRYYYRKHKQLIEQQMSSATGHYGYLYDDGEEPPPHAQPFPSAVFTTLLRIQARTAGDGFPFPGWFRTHLMAVREVRRLRTAEAIGRHAAGATRASPTVV
ncbi:hypothetical protein CDCA_CDCA01G0045 [Cyanidium caldarium]|uniref:Uncharacterized protein n=1 Tax=Cyanidium caldarium TaxID=2771 RepID=A0AAV9INY1_CYACA|nr:hypothetical protein CDCA_CDCA01G0045 [Cyanidium caldarium]